MGSPGQNVRRLIRTARERKGDWSQMDLAQAAKVSRGSVQSIEKGIALKEGKESAIETALDLPIGTIEDVRSGRISIEQALGETSRSSTPSRRRIDDPEFWWWLADQVPADIHRELMQLYTEYKRLVAERGTHSRPRDHVPPSGLQD